MSTKGVSNISSTPEYTAKCLDGYTSIDIFAYDCTFSGIPGTVAVLPTCKAWKGGGKTSHFQYTIPCSNDDTSFCLDAPVGIPEAAIVSKSATTGTFGDYKAMPTTILRQGGNTVESTTFPTQTAASRSNDWSYGTGYNDVVFHDIPWTLTVKNEPCRSIQSLHYPSDSQHCGLASPCPRPFG